MSINTSTMFTDWKDKDAFDNIYELMMTQHSDSTGSTPRTTPGSETKTTHIRMWITRFIERYWNNVTFMHKPKIPLRKCATLVAFTTTLNLDVIYLHKALKMLDSSQLIKVMQEELNNHGTLELVMWSHITYHTVIPPAIWFIKHHHHDI